MYILQIYKNKWIKLNIFEQTNKHSILTKSKNLIKITPPQRRTVYVYVVYGMAYVYGGSLVE